MSTHPRLTKEQRDARTVAATVPPEQRREMLRQVTSRVSAKVAINFSRDVRR